MLKNSTRTIFDDNKVCMIKLKMQKMLCWWLNIGGKIWLFSL